MKKLFLILSLFVSISCYSQGLLFVGTNSQAPIAGVSSIGGQAGSISLSSSQLAVPGGILNANGLGLLVSNYVNSVGLLTTNFINAVGTATTNGYQTFANLIGTTISNNYASLSVMNLLGTATTNYAVATFQTLLSAISGYSTANSILTTTGAALQFVTPASITSELSKASSSVFGVVEVDGTTITSAGGIITAVASAGSQTPIVVSVVDYKGNSASNINNLWATNLSAPSAINGAQYGMVGNGSDNTAALSNLYNASYAAGGSDMYVGPGTYILHHDMFYPSNGTINSANTFTARLIGSGEGNTIFQYNITPGTNDAACFDFRPNGQFTITGITIANSASSGTAASLPDIFVGGTKVYTDHVEFNVDGGPGRTNIVRGGTNYNNNTILGVGMGYGGYGGSDEYDRFWSTGCALLFGGTCNAHIARYGHIESTAADALCAIQIQGPQAVGNTIDGWCIELANSVPYGILITNGNIAGSRTVQNRITDNYFDDATSTSQICIYTVGDATFGANITIGNICTGTAILHSNAPYNGGVVTFQPDATFESSLNGGVNLENQSGTSMNIFGCNNSTNDLFRYSVTNGSGTSIINGRVTSAGIFQNTAGFASYVLNKSAPTSISFPATTITWTNPQNYTIELYINNSGVTGTAIQKNGTTIFSSVTGDATLHLQPGEYFSETYTIGSPTANYSPAL